MTQRAETIPCRFQDLGLIEYSEALQRQKDAVHAVIEGGAQTVFFCEHPTVLTLGRLGTEKNILVSCETLENTGVKVLRIDRGGEVTLHTPGQLVIYPVLNLNHFGRDLKSYLLGLEQVAIDLLRDFGIVANGISGQRGVWVGTKKIASIGIGVRKWVSYHGMALNINTDLRHFKMIRPCGLDVEMTSLEELTGTRADLGEIKKKTIDILCGRFRLANNGDDHG
jgi:lipoate-protein ligase B